MLDLNKAGGVYAVMNELDKMGLIDKSPITVTGKTVGENISGCEITRQRSNTLKKIIHTAKQADWRFSKAI